MSLKNQTCNLVFKKLVNNLSILESGMFFFNVDFFPKRGNLEVLILYFVDAFDTSYFHDFYWNK